MEKKGLGNFQVLKSSSGKFLLENLKEMNSRLFQKLQNYTQNKYYRICSSRIFSPFSWIAQHD